MIDTLQQKSAVRCADLIKMPGIQDHVSILKPIVFMGHITVTVLLDIVVYIVHSCGEITLAQQDQKPVGSFVAAVRNHVNQTVHQL